MGQQEEFKGSSDGTQARAQAAGGGLVAEVKALVEQYVEPRLNNIPDGEHEAATVIIGERQKIIDLRAMADAVRERPVFAKGASAHLTRASLEAHVNRLIAQAVVERESVVAWAQLSPPTIEVVFDSDSQHGHGWRALRASYAFPVSPEWARWERVFGKALSTSELAELLEDRINDVATREAVAAAAIELPMGLRQAQPAELLSLSEGLQVNVSRRVREVQRRDNGTADLAFAEEHDTRNSAGDPVRVPNGFVLALAPFVDGTPFAVPVRLRYAVRGGEITWTLTAHNADVALRRCVQGEVDAFGTATKVQVLWGKPESPAQVR